MKPDMAELELVPAYPESCEATWDAAGTAGRVIVPFAINGPQPDKLLMTGFGEDNVMEIARGLGARDIGNLAVCNMVYAPDAHGKFSGDTVRQSVLQGTVAVVEAIQARSKPGKDGNDNRLIGIGNSKGAGEQILAAYTYPKLWSRLISSAPLGITNQSLGTDLRSRRRQLVCRMKLADLPRALAISEERVNEMKHGIDFALDIDGSRMVRQLHALGLMERIFVGADDVMFRPEEYEQALELPGFVERVPGAGHMSLATPEGLDHMARIITLGLNDGRGARAALEDAA
jgi:hypothetical protein